MTRTGLKLTLAAVAALALTAAAPTTAKASDLNCEAGCTFSSFAGALWSTAAVQSTGTGVIKSFVQIGGNDPIKEGFNTNGTGLNDEVNGHLFGRQLSEVPIISYNNQLYYEFLLDINQEKKEPLLALNNVQICLDPTSGSLTAVGTCPTSPSYTMGTVNTSDEYIRMNYLLNNGSGSGDLFMYIPISSLGTHMTDWVYLFSQFGAVSGYENNDGFEEWAVRVCGESYGGVTLQCATPPPPTVPEPGTLVLFGTGLAGLVAVARRRRA